MTMSLNNEIVTCKLTHKQTDTNTHYEYVNTTSSYAWSAVIQNDHLLMRFVVSLYTFS